MNSNEVLSEYIVLDSVESSHSSDVICEDQEPINSQQKCNCHVEISQLKDKITNLKKRLSKDDAEKQPKAPIQILFGNKKVATKYRNRVERFIQDLVKSSAFPETDTQNGDDDYVESINVYNGFCVDKDDSTTNFDDTLYTTKGNVLNGTNDDCTAKKSNTGSLQCYNCRGDHHIKDCPKPIDRQQIAKNRAALTPNVTSNRYHVQEEFSQKFKPGHISDKVREALNIGSRDLPPYIYHMRILGYPPGWLSEAELEDSSLKLYNSNKDHERNDEDYVCTPVNYDRKKIVEFPGFNIHIKGNVRDDYKRLGFPPLRSNQLIENMPQIQPVNNANSRKRQHNQPEKQSLKRSRRDNNQDDDVIIEDDIRSPSPDNSTQADTSSQITEIPINSPNSPRSQSPSLNDLEAARTNLLNQLEDSPELPSNELSIEHSAISVSMETGSPYMASKSGISKLPSFDKFADGIGDHLNFENLDDYVGTFDKMRKVLSTIRQKVNPTS